MKRIILLILAAMPFLCPGMANAQTPGTGDSKYSLKPNKPLVFTDGSKLNDTELHKSQSGREVSIGLDQKVTLEYLPSRRALTGEMCAINKIINTVDVGSGQKDLDNILNDDLNDYAEFITTVKAGVGYNPIVSVRDNSCYYAPGTKAGFSIVAGSGNTVLSLDLLSALSITFYRDGELVKTVALDDGQSAGGVNLSLVNIPGTDQSAVSLTATAPDIFDEISLDFDGVTVGVGQLFRIKYAFVGDSKEFTITRNPENGSIAGAEAGSSHTPYEDFLIEKDGKDPANIEDATYLNDYHVNLDYVKGWNPVLLGLPFPIVSSQMENMLEADLYKNTVPLTPIVGLAYMGGVKFMMEYAGHLKKEVYEPGTEVGFSYLNAAVLDLSLGSAIEIILFDRNGNQVQTENLEAGVLALGVAAGGKGAASIVSKVPFSGAEIRFYGGVKIDVGGMGVYYAFVREAPLIRHHCPINPSADMSLCEEQRSIQLNANPDIAVTWSLGRFLDANGDEKPNPANITSGGYVTGLSERGQYEFIVTAADGCSDSVWINYDMFPEEVETEGDPLVNGNEGDGGTYVVSESHNGETSGGLLIIDHLEDAGNVVGDTNAAAKYVGGLKLADNNLIIGVKRTDGDIVNYNRDRDETKYEISKGNRVGFVFSNAIVGLNVGALHFMNIRLFKNGNEVYRHVVDESNLISAGLAGQDEQTRMRYSILVPWLDDDLDPINFDEIQLWSSGVLDLGGGEMDIYYAFIERDVTEDDEIRGSIGCSTMVLSAATSHTTIDYAAFGNPSLVKALGAMENISFIVDDDLETSFDDVHTAGVAARTTIPILLGRTLDFRNEVGVVMRSDTYLAGVTLGTGLTVYTMYRGEETGDKFTDWNVLGADVAGYGDKNIFYIHPTRLYDEVVIDYGQGVELIGKTQFFGLVMRTDSDGDGIPDCQDVSSCNSLIEILDVEDVCEGDEITIDAKGIAGNTYTLRFDDSAARNELTIVASTDPTVNVSYTYQTQKAGRYQVTFFNAEGLPIGAKMYEVHPLRTEWKTDAANTDWNNWNNWTDGTPYCCTDVIIPDNARRYPVLSGENTKGDEFCCNRIFIRPGASIEGVTKLNYTKAWVQLELDPNCYNLLSAPLHEMVTGDMFIPEDDEGFHNPEPFTELTDATAKENRFDPTIYQRMWNSVVKEQTWKGGVIDLMETDKLPAYNSTTWSRNFNHVNTKYEPMKGFSVWVDNGKLPETTRFRFTFPKENTVYNYYEDYSQTAIDKSEKIERETDKLGRFIYEENPDDTFTYERTDGMYGRDRKLYYLNDGVTISVTPEADSRYALFGNPFMSHINSRKLILENSDVIKGIMNPAGTLTYDSANDEFTSTGAPETIPPMTSVFLIIKQETSKADIRLTADMILPEAGVADEAGEESQGVTIRATSKGMISSMAVLTESSMTNAALIDSEVKTEFAIFSNADGMACDIVTAKSEVPLTIIADKDAEITLDFISNGVNRDEWTLVDRATGTEYPIDHSVTLPTGAGATAGRFVLRTSSVSAVEDMKQVEDVYLEMNGNEVTAHAASGHITSMEVYGMDGSMIEIARSEGSDAMKITVPTGICVVRVTTNGKTSSHKIAITK